MIPPSIPMPAPIKQPQSMQWSTYLIIDYITLNGPLRYQNSGPVLVTTIDYRTFYAAGRADTPALAMLGYEILHTYHYRTDLIGARAHFIAWKSSKWHAA